MLSGVYEAERSPSLLQTPQGFRHSSCDLIWLTELGVDIIRKPVYFSYSYPQAQIDLDREAFGEHGGDRGLQDPLVSSVASTLEVFSSVSLWPLLWPL